MILNLSVVIRCKHWFVAQVVRVVHLRRCPDVVYFVGRKRPLTELSPDQQQKIRQAYADTGFAHNDSEEGICVCTTEEKAIEACKDVEGKLRDGWFYYKIPVNRRLPNATADFGGSFHPASDTPVIQVPFILVDRNDVPSLLTLTHEAINRNTERLRRENASRATLLTDADCDFSDQAQIKRQPLAPK